jgi:hypothetical protein
MQAKIEPTRTILIPLQYNEKKVSEGKAATIGAEGFLKDYDRLTKKEIVDRFRQRTSLNERWSDHGVHFSLNFGKSEKLDNEKMARIASRYIENMGFEDQPYVVYRHIDAGHTHLHIVATSVRADGSGIHIPPSEYYRSPSLCRELEREFLLEKNPKVTQEDKQQFEVVRAQRVMYGEPGLKRAMSDVLNTVVDHYNYTSLEEFNAVLRQYNVIANPGREHSHLREVGGLLYHALDADGKRVGKPIKASLFLVKPTLKHLEQRFAESQSLREASKERLQTAIDWALAGQTPDWSTFKENLERDGIAVVTDIKGDNGNVFFVDHVGKAAFAGNSLGPAYDLVSIQGRLAPEQVLSEEQTQRHHLNLHV